MTTLNQKKVILLNDETSMRKPYLSTRIYLTASKVAQCRLFYENRREKEETKKETSKKTSTRKLHLQKRCVEIFRNSKTP